MTPQIQRTSFAALFVASFLLSGCTTATPPEVVAEM